MRRLSGSVWGLCPRVELSRRARGRDTRRSKAKGGRLGKACVTLGWVSKLASERESRDDG